MNNTIYAIIYNNEVKNRILCEDYTLANTLARASFGNEAFAVDTTKYATAIGDIYESGNFYHASDVGTKEEVEYIPSEQENITLLKSKLLTSKLVLAETYEDKLLLENRIDKLELAITNIFEQIKGDN